MQFKLTIMFFQLVELLYLGLVIGFVVLQLSWSMCLKELAGIGGFQRLGKHYEWKGRFPEQFQSFHWKD